VIAPTLKRQAGWLLFDAALPAPLLSLSPDETLEPRLLTLGAHLPVGCKYALVADSGLRLRAERSEPDEAEAAARMADIESAIASGFAAAAHSLGIGGESARSTAKSPVDTSRPDLSSLCREAGWIYTERSPKALSVDLGIPGRSVSALVELRDRHIAVEAELVPSISSARVFREALAIFGLRVNGAFRMARTVLRNTHFEPADAHLDSIWLEAPIARDASSAELAAALGSLAVTARHCALEARLLADDERIARAYASRCRWEARAPGTDASARPQEALGKDPDPLPDHVGRKSSNQQGGK
jgi:hypothetical protein